MFGFKKQILGLKESLEDRDSQIRDLERQAASLRRVLASMAEGVIILDKDTRIISLNSSAEKIFGISEKEVLGKLFLAVVPNNDISELISKVLNKREFVSQELTLVWPIQRTFQVNASLIPEEDGAINRCLLVIHDISEIRRLEKVRSDFVANVSHEIKTPLTSIKGFVETLLEGALEDKENAKHFLNIIQDHANRLDNLVSDLLSLSFLESKEIVLEKQKVDLGRLASDILSGFRSQLRKKSIEIRNELPSGLSITADRDKLGQVFTNLIDNAVKFNREKGIIRIYSQDLDNKVKLIVEDNGLGIPVKDIPRIFERFYRVDKARSHEMGGTGLGLSIVKHIIELHDGTVGVESTEGIGSKFFFILPRG
ncbi:MAG: ATP-binding protein [Candidatus Omnitrophota bacterium]|nr:ATP-binding protein [Candidatus Omnitrophota bacterium]